MDEKLFEQQEQPSDIDAFKESIGEDANDEWSLYGKLLRSWGTGGKERARQMCIYDADKFSVGDDPIKLYLEKVLFDAGESGLEKKTPWNHRRRREEGLPMLFDYEK